MVGRRPTLVVGKCEQCLLDGVHCDVDVPCGRCCELNIECEE